jgi:hypothetical protein
MTSLTSRPFSPSCPADPANRLRNKPVPANHDGHDTQNQRMHFPSPEGGLWPRGGQPGLYLVHLAARLAHSERSP